MQTRKALEKLSKGEKSYQDRANSTLLEQGKKFIDMYDAKEREILAAKAQDSVPLPFLETIKRKVAKMVEKPNDELPVVTRFDLYTGIRKMSERAPSDNGLKRLAAQLERAWHAEPLGALTYGDVSGIVKVYKDQYPRSKAADAVEAECARVGLHKLPVAKLARIASTIETQADYDSAIEANGFAGDRIDQVRARTLIRELVALRGAKVCSIEKAEVDTRSTEERVIAGIALKAQLSPPPGKPEEEELLDGPPEMGLEDDAPGAPEMAAPPPSLGDGQVDPGELAEGADVLQQIQEVAEDVVMDAPPEAQDFIQHEMAEGHNAPVGTAEWGAEEILNEGHEFPPPSPEWIEEELQELGGEPMGAGPAEPAMPMMAAKGKGIPLPDGKIKEQPNAKNALDSVPEDGAKALKAAEIEDALLNGQRVRSANAEIAIFINENDEVELWNKSAGRVCDIEHLDVAIADFINMNNYAKSAAKKRASRTVNVVDVPCEMCASITKFELTASRGDSYGCDCGHEIDAGAVLDLVEAGVLRVAQEQVFDMDRANELSDADYGKLAEQIVMSGIADNVGALNKACMDAGAQNSAVDPDRLRNMVMTMAPQVARERMIDFEAKKAQMAAPGAPAPAAPMAPPAAPAAPAPAAPAAPAAGEEGENAVTDMPLDEVIKGAFVNYKAQGMQLREALRTFMKEHGDLMESGRWTPEADAMLVAMQTQYYTAAVPAPAPAAPAQVTAQKVLEPSVRKRMKDMVSVGGKPLGKDTSQDDSLPSPGRIKQQQGKPDGKLSDTNLGPDSSGKDVELAKPKKTTPTKGKLPNKNMGSDTEGDEPFKTPGLGSKPSVSKKK